MLNPNNSTNACAASIRVNGAKRKLLNGEVVYSSSVRLPESGLCELLGYAGWDFVLLDGEHGAMDALSIDRMVQGCFAGGTAPIVRVLRPNDPEAVMHALDLGAQGILMPHCRTAEDACNFKNAGLYPPEGTRGFGPGRATNWGRISGADYLASANSETLLLALIEDPEAIDNVESIAAVGLDGLWVGVGDLALGYGVGTDRDHPKVTNAAARILAACQAHNIACGYPARNSGEARWAVQQGYRLIGFGGAEQYVMTESRRFLSDMSQA